MFMTVWSRATRRALGRRALGALGSLLSLLVFAAGWTTELELHSPVDGRHHFSSCAHDVDASAGVADNTQPGSPELIPTSASPSHRDACPPCAYQRVGRIAPAIASAAISPASISSEETCPMQT